MILERLGLADAILLLSFVTRLCPQRFRVILFADAFHSAVLFGVARHSSVRDDVVCFFFLLLKCIHVCVDSFSLAFAHFYTRNIRIDNSSQRPCKAILLTLFQRQLDCPLGQSGRLWLTWRNWQKKNREEDSRLLFLENFANQVFFSESIQGHYFCQVDDCCCVPLAVSRSSRTIPFLFMKMWLHVDDRMTVWLYVSERVLLVVYGVATPQRALFQLNF